MRYRRALVAGATWFFTVNLEDRASRLLVDRIDVLRGSVHHVRRNHPFEIVAFVVLPDHIHAILRLPENDASYSMLWSLIKAGFSRNITPIEHIGQSRKRKGERGLWQRRFWEHMIRDEDDLLTHIDYIHFNPVKHGHVARASDWPHSTFHRYVADGLLPEDWGCADPPDGRFGEPQ
ncbi:REP-associated tyrosine transposase [Rhodospira trueperi]|uniref:REP-associated tyrosine transposase n=1 Tax=Rhodospira trueperi TaxID=69960 RepID=UPI000B8A604A|nr:transposase [Rhodospira trueperi]